MRKKAVLALLGFVLMPAIFCPPMEARANKSDAPPMKLKVGDVAPDFKLSYFDGSDEKDISLSQYRGKSNVVVAFYIFAFTGG